jgi:hypothetical protein
MRSDHPPHPAACRGWLKYFTGPSFVRGSADQRASVTSVPARIQLFSWLRDQDR